MNTFIETQKWRYATKKFDATKKVAPENIEFLKEAIQLSASSYGLQLYKVYIIENQELKEKLLPLCWNQQQVVDASHIFVFASYATVKEEYIDAYSQLIAQTRETSVESLQGYADFMKTTLLKLSPEQQKSWAAKQTYIALGNLLQAAAELKIDATPMEGFLPEKVNELLELDKQNLNVTLITPVGYRHPEDAAQHLKKVRKPINELFINL